jgi:flagellar basal-body rod modification protein FlgD
MVDAVGSIGGTTAASEAAASSHVSGVGELGSDAFLKLLVAQLRYQNPLEPTDGTEFLQQTAQFTTVEALQTIAETQQNLIGLQQVGLAFDVVGKDVTALDADGNQITGTVDAVRFVADGPILTVAGIEIPLSEVLSVEAASPADSTT